MSKLPHKGSAQEKCHTGYKAPRGFSICTVSDRSLRNNNSSRIWWVMQRGEIAREFEADTETKKSVDSSCKSDPNGQIDTAFKIPARKKQAVVRKGIFNADGTMTSQPYRSLRKKGQYSLHVSSKESTFGKTEEEVEEFYDSLIHKSGRKMAAIIPNLPPDEKTEEIDEEQEETISNAEQTLKTRLEFQPGIFTRLRSAPCVESGLSYDIFARKLCPHPKAIFIKNDSSRVKDLITTTSESKVGLTENSRRTVYTGRKNYSFQMAELLEEIPRPLPKEITIKPSRLVRRKVFDRCLHATSQDFLLGKTPEELSIISVHLGIKGSKRVFPHLKKLQKNWPNYPLPKIPRKRVLSDITNATKQIASATTVTSPQTTNQIKNTKKSDSTETTKQIKNTKASNANETTAICKPDNHRHYQFLDSEKERMLRRCRVFPY